jgi:hypothetical protein
MENEELREHTATILNYFRRLVTFPTIKPMAGSHRSLFIGRGALKE